jgi:hypothetical protein
MPAELGWLIDQRSSQKLHTCIKTFTENWDSKRHLMELSWPI